MSDTPSKPEAREANLSDVMVELDIFDAEGDKEEIQNFTNDTNQLFARIQFVLNTTPMQALPAYSGLIYAAICIATEVGVPLEEQKKLFLGIYELIEQRRKALSN